ncbi:unnamed protein product, partial [Brenthis ino]
MEIKVDVHIVHPSSSKKERQIKKDIGPGAYGSWCTPDISPKHVVGSKLNSVFESRIKISDDIIENVQSKEIVPYEKNRLARVRTLSPRRIKIRQSKKETISEIIELDHKVTEEITETDSIASEAIKPIKRLSNEIVPAIETPQSPVPTSPSRDRKSEAWKRCPTFCDPYMPIDPQGRRYISWLLFVTFCYSYNAWCIALRATFPYQTPENTPFWMIADYFCDFIYLLDVIFVKPRLMFLNEGFWVVDPVDCRRNYKKKLQYKFDVISLLPLDILYIYFGADKVILRFPRVLKLQTFWEFHRAMDRVLSSPYVVRIGKSLFYIFYLIHLNACAYYAMSAHIGLASNGWVYDNVGNAYIRCFYFATKTATSIGKNPKPENTAEYLFMTAAWLMGVFVFALLIGQIRDIIATATRAKTEYRKNIDGCSQYMRRLNLPVPLQRRVACWFNYTWNQQRCFDEPKILNSLPYNMKRDVALEVHMSTLSKVQLFRDCSASLLRDLVLQLRPEAFLPGDAVVRRGDVGHHMYIVKSGECHVMSPDEKEVLATLCEGSVFGEISLLGIDGLRRRTATVISRGYSSLFALSRNDLETALEHHTEAAQILRRRADQIIRENAARQARQKLEEENEMKNGHLRRRKSNVNEDIKPLEEGRRRSSRASAQSKRKFSSVSENQSLSIVLPGDNGSAKIVLSTN